MNISLEGEEVMLMSLTVHRSILLTPTITGLESAPRSVSRV